MRNTNGISLIALTITIVVIIILATIVLSAGGETTNKAQLAVFTNDFSDYQEKITLEKINIKQRIDADITDAQLNYMIANGLKHANYPEVKEMDMPVGYKLPNTIKRIYSVGEPVDMGNGSSAGDIILDLIMPKAYAIGKIYDPYYYDIYDTWRPEDPSDPYYNNPASFVYEEPIVAYLINDGFISGYNQRENNPNGSAGYRFYGNANGEEYHFITSNGHVFTIPGFASPQDDGTILFYISNDKGAYYTVTGQSGLAVGEYNRYGDRVDELKPITKLDFLEANGGKLYGKSIYGDDCYGYAQSTELESRNTVIDKQYGVAPNIEGPHYDDPDDYNPGWYNDVWEQ